MAELRLDDEPVKMGRLLRVYNALRKKFSNANRLYYAVWVEDADGGNERCLLFTKNELDKAEHRAAKNPEDIPQRSVLTDLLD